MARVALAALIAAPLMSGCVYVSAHEASTPAVVSIDTSGMPGEMEPIHAAAFTADSALFQVSSNGCTDRDDIEPVVSRVDEEVVITLRRLTPDNCRAWLADGVQLEFSLEELGLETGERARINNPFLIR